MIGRTISHYRILAKIGEGGMGAVYRAEDLRLDRRVAIKFLPVQLSEDPEAKQRFLQEAKTASALDHPNIGVIHEIDEDEEGRLFIVMGLYEGGCLKDKIRDSPVETQEALFLAREIAAGLARAHERGIIHRDIKPGNVLLSPDGQVKIVDFGLARYLDQTRITRADVSLGTPAYMSPEQAQGQELDGKSDLFSLGVVLYELLTGRLPFPGDHPSVILFGIVNGRYKPLAEHRPGLADALQRIVDRALAKNPDERYQSAREFKADLDEQLGFASEETRTLRATKPGAVQGAPLHRRRLRFALPAAAALVLAASVFIGLKLFTSDASGSEHSMAIIEFQDLVSPEDATLSAGLAGLLHVGLVEASPVRIVSPDYLMDLRRRVFGATHGQIGGDQALEVAKASGASLLLTGQIIGVAGKRILAWRLVDTSDGSSLAASRVQGDEIAAAADSIIAAVLPRLARASDSKKPLNSQPVAQLTSESSEAYRHYTAGLLALESGTLRDAVAELENAVAIDSSFALAHFALSRAHSAEASGMSEAVMAHAERAWELASGLGFKDRLRLQAWLERLRFEIPAAIKTYNELLARWPDDRDVLKDLGYILYSYWYMDEAVRIGRQGLNLYPEDLEFGVILQTALAYTGHAEEALSVSQSQVDRHRGEMNAWSALGERYWEMGRPDDAQAAWRQALTLSPSSWVLERAIAYCPYSRGDVEGTLAALMEIFHRPGLSPGERFSILHSDYVVGLALLPAELGRYRECVRIIDEFRTSTPDSTVADLIDSRLYWIYMATGRPAEAEALARDWVERADERGGPMARMDLARTLLAQGRIDEAKRAAGDLSDPQGRWAAITKMAAMQISAEISLASGNPQAAVKELEAMLAGGVVRFGRFGLFFRDLLAQAYRKADRPADAVNVLQDLLKTFGGHAIAHYELGLCYEELGEDEKAVESFRRFLAAWSKADEGLPQPEDARRRLERLTALP